MGFWDDLSRFAGNATGGFIGESDEERRRKQKKPTGPSPIPVSNAPQPGTIRTGSVSRGNVSVGTAQPGSIAAPKRPQPRTFGIADDRRKRMDGFLDQGRSFEEISDQTGLGVEEVRQYADENRPGYGTKPFNLADAVQDIGAKLVGDVGKSVTKMSGLTTLNTKDQENAYQAARGALQRGEITDQKFFEMTKELGGDIVGKKVTKDEKTGEVRIEDQNPLEFAQSFTDAGYNAASVMPVAGGAKLAGLAAKPLAKGILKEGAAWGTVDTANDVVQGEFSPEQMAANYALNIGLTGAGAAGGKLVQDARMRQAAPDRERGSLGQQNILDNLPDEPLKEGEFYGLGASKSRGRYTADGAIDHYLETHGYPSQNSFNNWMASNIPEEMRDTLKARYAERTPSEPTDQPTIDKEAIQAQLDALRAGGKQQGYVEKEAPVREVSPEALLERAIKAGMSEASATSLMKKYGRNRFAIMLDNSNNLRGADNPNALAASVLKKIPDGNTTIGGTATKADPKPVDPQAQALSGEPLRSGEQVMPDGSIVNTITGEIRDPSFDPTPTMGERIEDARPETPETQPEEPSLAGQLSDETRDAYEREKARWADIDNQLEQAGFDPTDIRQKITAAARGEYEPTDKELDAFGFVKGQLDEARSDLAAQGVEFEGNIDYYRPEQADGSVRTSPDEYTREDLLNFGYSKQRKNAFELDEIDYTANPEIDYTFKAHNRQLILENAIARSAEQDGRTVTRESVEQAARDTIELQDTVKDHASKSGKVIKHDTLTKLNGIGQAEGYKQEINPTRIGVAMQEPKAILEQAGIYDKGFEQYVNSTGYASELMRLTQEVDGELAKTLPNSLRKAFPGGDDSSIGNIAAWAERRLQKAETYEQQHAIITGAFRMGAKAELTRLGKSTVFANKKLSQVVNEQMNHVLLNDAYKRNALETVDRFVTHRINESLRGANVLSAMFEASDFFNILSDFGGKNLAKSKIGFGKVDGDYHGMSKRYGKAHQHFLSEEMPEVTDKLDEIWSNPNTNVAQKLYESAKNVRDKTMIFTYVERWKTELFLRQADEFYRAKGLKGKELVDTVNGHFDKTMLPSTVLTVNRLLNKAPKAMTQYLSWAINSTKRLGRTIGGNNEYGKYADMGRGSRIARGVGMEILPKAAAAMAIGVPITQVMGGRDWTGTSTGDFSGIEEDDKTAQDEIINTLAVSPALGMIANLYNGYRVNEEAMEEGDAESPWFETAMKKNGSMLIPYFSQGKKVYDVVQGQQQGYYTNRDGRVQAGKLSDSEAVMGGILGKSYTPTFRDMRDNPDLISVARGKAKVQDLAVKNETVDNLVRAVGKPTNRDYTRPLNKDYTKAFKEAEEGARGALLEGGRQFNDYLDTLRQQQPEVYNRYISTMDGDSVKPEYWRTIAFGKDGKADLTIFKILADRKRQLKKDLGKGYDPVYDLPDDQAMAFLQYRSAATGDNIALRNTLNKEQWYKDLRDKRDAFYDANPLSPEGDEFKKTDRVKSWEKLDDELTNYYWEKGDEKPSWADKYPLVYQLKQYDFDSQESKDFFKNNYDAWKAQKDEFDKAQLDVINKMRKIEGHPPMSWEAYQQATEIADTDEEDDEESSGSSKSGYYDKDGKWVSYKKGSRSGGSGGGSNNPPNTGVADTLDNLGNQSAGMKLPTGPKGKLKNLKTVVKKPRATRRSKIRIRI